MEENKDEIIFVAYCRKLLRRLLEIETVLSEENTKEAQKLLDELIEETKTDIEK